VGRRLRDFGVTVVVMAVLFGLLMLINPRVRERVALISDAAPRDRWSATGGPVSAAAMDALAITSGFAGDNPLMFAFFVVAAVLFMLMVKMS
jgi:hypothetical protein